MPFDSAPQMKPPGHRWLALSDVPPRLRLKPVSTALWRALMLDCGALAVGAIAAQRAGRQLDAMAITIVLKAIHGDIRACKMIANRIDGPIRRPPGSQRSVGNSGHNDSGREAAIASIVAAYKRDCTGLAPE